MSASDYYYITLLYNTTTFMYKYLLPVFYIVGNIGNILSAFIFLKKSWNKNVCVLYFKVCLFLSLLYINTTVITAILLVGYDINLFNSNVISCKLLFYCPFVLITLLPTILILATIDRLLISSQNVNTRLYSSKRLAYFSISISTVFWLVFNLHIIIKTNMQQLYPYYFSCYYDLSNVYLLFVSYSVMINNTLICILMIILSILAFKNVRQIRTIPRQQRRQIRTMTKKDFQLLRCLFVQDIVYVSLGALLGGYFTYSTITYGKPKTLLEQSISTFANNFLTFFYYTFYCDNFIIFFSVSKAFRHELKRLAYRFFGKDLVTLRDEYHHRQQPL
ncbi:hypothetical protein I4U23_020160 [Adineta vaga]|nr:hypothetical protein I4U23_020160 [Adineta vaga]